MHEFDKCKFCANYDVAEDWCGDIFCEKPRHTSFILDAKKVLTKANEMGISVTDVLNLIRECNRE